MISKSVMKYFFVTVLATLLIAACTSDNNTVANGGTGGTGVSLGTITDFGSVFVNGVEFETNSTSVTVDGQSGLSQSDLKIGMVVNVSGSISGTTGVADSIVFEDVLEGPVEMLVDANTIKVMGQLVQVDSTTLYDNIAGFGAIQVDHLLEISGHVKGDGLISANLIELKTLPAEFEVKGFAKNHNHPARTIQIGDLIVNYTSALIGDMPNPLTVSWNGLLVEAKGDIYDGTTLTATKVEPEGLGVADADDAEVEGFVTAVITSPSLFVVGSQTVQTTGSTVFEGGLPEDVVVGVKLEAEGVLANGVLTADKISFRDNIRIEADVAGRDLGAGTLTLKGLPGVTVVTLVTTEYGGGANTLSDIPVDSHVRIRGRELSGNQVEATELILRSADTRVILQGPLDNVARPNLTILGVTVDTTPIVDPDDFRNVMDQAIGADAFFGAIATGDLVKARGDLLMGIVVLDQVELEE